jgi:cell division septum initiation protein DivIVA
MNRLDPERGNGSEPSLPEFTIALRGYDRAQVDNYVAKQLALLVEARGRLERDAHQLSVEARPTRRTRPRELTASPHSFEELGEQVGRILREAWLAAEDLRREARAEAAAIVRDAETRAGELRPEGG